MKNRLYLAIVLACTFTCECLGWGQKGHDTVCAIAQNHLTDKSKAIANDLLEGRSLVYWANWLDNASNTPEYAYSKTWHYKDVEMGKDYDEMPDAEKGDLVTALNAQIKKLNEYQEGKCNKEEATLALKMLIHLLGDMHQPMHMGRVSDLGGNRHPVQFFNNQTNLHSVWDSQVLESGHKWSHTEWVEEIDRGLVDESAIVSGSIDDWARETWKLSIEVYLGSPIDTKLSYDYVAKWTPVIEQQLLKGGLRLAHVLNTIFQ